MSHAISFLPAQALHLQLLADILNHYICNTTVSFYTNELSADEMYEKVFFADPIYGTFVILWHDEIAGYCTLMPWKKQQAYRHTAEVSIYLKPAFCGKGIGSSALQFLADYALKNKVKSIIAGCCSENISSIKLFQKNGYQVCANFSQVGYKFGRFLDTVYLQKHFKDS